MILALRVFGSSAVKKTFSGRAMPPIFLATWSLSSFFKASVGSTPPRNGPKAAGAGPLTPGTAPSPRPSATAGWRVHTEHPLTTGSADGSLAEAAFRHYLVQDYLFLTEFARAYALSVYKSPKLADMREAAAGLSAILDIEMDLHVKLCAGWGLLPSDLEQTPPAVEMLAYTRYVLDAGMRGDLLELKVALAPCVIGYAEIATRLASRPDARTATNPYRVWIAEYAGAPYQAVAATAREHLERLAYLSAPPAR